MNVTDRLDAAEEALLNLGGDALALDIVIRALIGTHPDPELLCDVMKHLFAEREERIRDVGFEKGYAAKTAGATADGFRKRADGWLKLVPGDQPGD